MTRNTKLIRIKNVTHTRLKDVARKEGLTITSLAEVYIDQGLRGFADTLHYFKEKYGKKEIEKSNW